MPSPRPSGLVLEGTFTSCPIVDAPGEFEERIFDYYNPQTRKPVFELHMGPRESFTLFPGIQDAHRAHDSGRALIYGRQIVLGHSVELHRLDGSQEDCFTSYVRITRSSRNN